MPQVQMKLWLHEPKEWKLASNETQIIQNKISLGGTWHRHRNVLYKLWNRELVDNVKTVQSLSYLISSDPIRSYWVPNLVLVKPIIRVSSIVCLVHFVSAHYINCFKTITSSSRSLFNVILKGQIFQCVYLPDCVTFFSQTIIFI